MPFPLSRWKIADAFQERLHERCSTKNNVNCQVTYKSKSAVYSLTGKIIPKNFDHSCQYECLATKTADVLTFKKFEKLKKRKNLTLVKKVCTQQIKKVTVNDNVPLNAYIRLTCLSPRKIEYSSNQCSHY